MKARNATAKPTGNSEKLTFKEVKETMTTQEKIDTHGHNSSMLFKYYRSLVNGTAVDAPASVVIETVSRMKLVMEKIQVIGSIINTLSRETSLEDEVNLSNASDDTPTDVSSEKVEEVLDLSNVPDVTPTLVEAKIPEVLDGVTATTSDDIQ